MALVRKQHFVHIFVKRSNASQKINFLHNEILLLWFKTKIPLFLEGKHWSGVKYKDATVLFQWYESFWWAESMTYRNHCQTMIIDLDFHFSTWHVQCMSGTQWTAPFVGQDPLRVYVLCSMRNITIANSFWLCPGLFCTRLSMSIVRQLKMDNWRDREAPLTLLRALIVYMPWVLR